MGAEVDVEEDGEEDEQDRLDEEHQNQISGDLAEVDRRLVAGDEQQALPAVVLALGQERPAEPDEPAQDEPRSEEHTSELQSPCNLVCRLLLEKKKKQTFTR